MIHPSYSELIQAINDNSEDDDNTMLLNSRYSLVLATSKRARQIIGGARPLVSNAEGKKALSIAIDELYRGKVKILSKEAAESAGITMAQTEAVSKLSGAEDPASAFDEQEEFGDELEDLFEEDLNEEDFNEEEPEDDTDFEEGGELTDLEEEESMD